MTTTFARRALVLSSDAEPVTGVVEQLVAAGYDVHQCHETGGRGFPCVGLATGECPLDLEGGVDVAVDVRHHPWPHPTLREHGVTCALRNEVPLVVIGRNGHPFTPWTTATLPDADDLVAHCEQAIDDALEPARAAIRVAVRDVLDVHGLDAPFAVEVAKRRGRVHVAITLDAPSQVRAMAVTRAAVALRRHDHMATSIEIDLVDQR